MTAPRTTKIAVETIVLGRADDVQVVVDGDEGGRAAADRVEERDQLRHGGHLARVRAIHRPTPPPMTKPTTMMTMAVVLRPPGRSGQRRGR